MGPPGHRGSPGWHQDPGHGLHRRRSGRSSNIAVESDGEALPGSRSWPCVATDASRRTSPIGTKSRCAQEATRGTPKGAGAENGRSPGRTDVNHCSGRTPRRKHRPRHPSRRPRRHPRPDPVSHARRIPARAVDRSWLRSFVRQGDSRPDADRVHHLRLKTAARSSLNRGSTAPPACSRRRSNRSPRCRGGRPASAAGRRRSPRSSWPGGGS